MHCNKNIYNEIAKYALLIMLNIEKIYTRKYNINIMTKVPHNINFLK